MFLERATALLSIGIYLFYGKQRSYSTMLTYRKVHQIFTHIVFNQKNAAKKKKSIQTAGKDKNERNNYS